METVVDFCLVCMVVVVGALTLRWAMLVNISFVTTFISRFVFSCLSRCCFSAAWLYPSRWKIWSETALSAVSAIGAVVVDRKVPGLTPTKIGLAHSVGPYWSIACPVNCSTLCAEIRRLTLAVESEPILRTISNATTASDVGADGSR